MKPSNKRSRDFKNPLLEKLSRTHISVPLTLFSIYSGALLYYSLTYTELSMIITVSLFALGLLAFTLTEYLMHRYVFHMATYTEWRRKIQYTSHGVHHEFPKDKTRLAMPPIASVTLSTALLLLLRLIIGDLVFAFLPGFLMGYAGYLFVHYIIHSYQPPKNAFKILWIHHGIHHFKNNERAFGVSSPLWDYVFRTMP